MLHDALTKQSNILNGYVMPCYEVLHTHGREYIVEDILDVMRKDGINI